MRPKTQTAFDKLVQEVSKQHLKALDVPSGLDAALDGYIQEHQLCFVLDDNHFYIRYHEEWLRLSWFKLRRLCPFVFKNSKEYMALQAPLMHRLKRADRIYRKVRWLDVRFE